jgi:hypothetical protein
MVNHTEDDEDLDGVDYRRLSTRELLVLAERGDEEAELELERRRNILRD